MDTSEQPAISEINGEKLQEWEAISAGLSQVTDALGKPIDAGIFEIIVGLHAHGISTRQSCEGHLDQGEMYPWVDMEFETDEIKRLQEQYSSLDQQVEDLEMEGRVTEQELEHKYQEVNKLRRDLARLRVEESEKVHNLLREYYAANETENLPYDLIIVLTGNRLHHIGGSYQILNTPEVQSSNLSRYQDDMRRFSGFLKNRFMTS